jgi:hypothetical protein
MKTAKKVKVSKSTWGAIPKECPASGWYFTKKGRFEATIYIGEHEEVETFGGDTVAWHRLYTDRWYTKIAGPITTPKLKG